MNNKFQFLIKFKKENNECSIDWESEEHKVYTIRAHLNYTQSIFDLTCVQSRRPSSSSSSSSSSNNFKRRAYCSSLFFFWYNLKRKKDNRPTATRAKHMIATLVPVLPWEVAWEAAFFFEPDESSERPEKTREITETSRRYTIF